TDPTIVDHPWAQSRLDNPAASGMGVWSFGRLVTDVAGTGDPAVLAEQLMLQLSTRQVVNGFTMDPVTVLISSPSVNAAGTALSRWCRTSTGKLDLTRAPFRLLAIVNRFDLRQGTSGAGEVRFIFNLLETDDSCRGTGVGSNTLPAVTGGSALNVIFEFAQP